MEVLVAEGISLAEANENLLAEGEEGLFVIYLQSPLDEMAVQQIQADLLSQDVVLTAPVVQEAGALNIRFRKALWPVVALIAALGAAGIIGWQLFKDQLSDIMPLVLIGGAGLVLVLLATMRS